MTKKMLEILNAQVNHEMTSSYSYLGNAAYFDAAGFRGFAKWFKVQANEEQAHAMKIYDYIVTRGGVVVFKDIKAANKNFKAPKDFFSDTLKQEQNVTKQIYAIVDLAMKEGDHATLNFAQWFVKEQVEEEASVTDILQRFDLVGDNKIALVMLDKELGARSA